MIMNIITLHYNVDPILKTTPDKVAYILRHFVYNPGFTSSWFPDMEISLRGLAAKTPNNPEVTGQNIANALSQAFTRILPEETLQVNVGIVYNSTSFYTVQVKITDSVGNLIIPAGIITVKDQKMTLQFEGI